MLPSAAGDPRGRFRRRQPRNERCLAGPDGPIVMVNFPVRRRAMTVVRAAARATRRGATANFTGEVFQDEVLVGQLPSRMRATVVSFTPGARTGWHAHPVGQTLY